MTTAQAHATGAEVAYGNSGKDMLVVVRPLSSPPASGLWGHIFYRDASVDDVSAVLEAFLDGRLGTLTRQAFSRIGGVEGGIGYILPNAHSMPIGPYLVSCTQFEQILRERSKKP